ncbi:MAG: hypothetical protein WBM44_20365 [Waterburya sp.]
MKFTQLWGLRKVVAPKLVTISRFLLWVEPETLYGTQVITHITITLSFLLAAIASATNLINSLGVFPILTAAFRNFGLLSLPLAITVSALLNFLQNKFTSLLVRRGEFKRLARAGAVGLISLQVFLTGGSTIGGQIANSKPALAADHSTAKITQAQNDLAQTKQTFMQSALYLDTKQNCELGRKRMDAPPPASERDRVILETVGSFGERERLGVPATPESFCGKWSALQSETQAKYSRLDRPIEEALMAGLPPIKIAERVLPHQYETEFTRQGTIADGNTEFGVAVSRLFRLLVQGRIGELGTSLLLCLLSAVTSITLVLALIAYAKHPAIIMSFSPKAGLIKKRFLQ